MGSGGSRLGGSRRPLSRSHHSHHHRHRRPRFKRALSSFFICGALPPANFVQEMEDDPAEKLVNSLECHTKKIEFPAKSSNLPNVTESEFANHTIEVRGRTERNTVSLSNSYGADVQRDAGVNDKGKGLSKTKEIDFDASTSYEDQHSPQLESMNGRANVDAVDRGIYLMDGYGHQNYAGSIQSRPSNGGIVESLSDGVSVENSMGEMMVFHDCETSLPSTLPTSSIDDNFQQAPSPSGLGFLVTERDQSHRDGNVLQVDVVSVSLNTPSTNASELSPHEAIHNSREFFWDAFSRRGSRRNVDSRSLIFTIDDSNGLDSHDGWLLDFNSDFFDNGAGGGVRSHGSSYQQSNERRWHSSSEMWERFRDAGHNPINRRTAASCPSGIHPGGACSCVSMIRAEESGARASISRIVMLAEALYEVLDEIHRQPMSQSLSVVSLPAPESVVDSLPVKEHKILERSKNGDDVVQCYICLAEYEEGDKIRILPCHHEYHVSCVDKWLKEIHGVCPLCRGDIREGVNLREGAISGSGVH